MSLYQKLINNLYSKKTKEIVDTENLFDAIEDIDISQLEEKINSKIGNFKKNIPLFDLLFRDALKRENLQNDNISGDLSEKEKQMILDMLEEFITQFEELELTCEVESLNDGN